MSAPTDLELGHGLDAEPVGGRRLRAGPIEVMLYEGELRYARVGAVEIVRRIHTAVRDAAWNTITGDRTEESIEEARSSFSVAYNARYRAGELSFAARCAIEGGADGTLSFEIDGVAERDFPYRRIGICVLHPTTFAGCAFEASAGGRVESGRLPELVAPQIFDGETFPPLFAAFDRLRLTTPEGLAVTMSFEGDLFEMEDQRNWTDASFKSYSRSPEARVEAWAIPRGARIRQRVTIAVEGGGPPELASPPPVTLAIGDTVTGRLPALGLSLHAETHGVSRESMAALRDMQLDHLRVDVRPDDDHWREELRRAIDFAQDLGCGLELAVFMAAEGPEPEALADALEEVSPELRRVLVLERDAEVTNPALARRVRDCCGEALAGVPVGGGTDLDFAEVNRHAATAGRLELLAYPVSPQVHADDDISLVETPAAQADTVIRAMEIAPERPVAVTPITLKPRYHPDVPGAELAPTELLATVDSRQMSLLAAGWTLASIGYLGVAGAASATYFETIGRRGVIESSSPPPADPPFPSQPGMVFPVYHVLRALARAGRAPLLRAEPSDPLAVQGVHFGVGEERLLIVANLRGEPLDRLLIGPVPGVAEVRRLDVEAARRAAADAGAFERDAYSLSPIAGQLEIELSPFELMFLRWTRQ